MELSEYRVTAGDGKILMRFYSFLDQDLDKELKEKALYCVDALCREAVAQYREKLLVLYEENEDPGKRMHTSTLRCEITALPFLAAENHGAILNAVFKKGAKTVLELQQSICYDARWKLFYMG